MPVYEVTLLGFVERVEYPENSNIVPPVYRFVVSVQARTAIEACEQARALYLDEGESIGHVEGSFQ